MQKLSSYLRTNIYPGRGIIVGKTSADIVMAYFIMGRSANSKNRIFIQTNDGVKTQAFDEGKMVDPSLIIYSPVRQFKDKTIITNGDQTDTIFSYLSKGDTFENALKSREFEPDEPNYTPRISAIVNKDGSFKMSILKSENGDVRHCLRYFYEYCEPIDGQGRLIHTYQDNGNPLPSFKGEPIDVTIDGDIDKFTDLLWTSLNPENKVSLYVKYINRSNRTEDIRIINKNK